MRNIWAMVITVFLVIGCSQNNKKNLITFGTGAGTGLATYSIWKSFMGQSGTGGNINQVIAITTIGTLLGVFMGSEIADNLTESEQHMVNVSLDKNTATEWTKKDNQGNETIATIDPVETIKKNNKLCKQFTWELEELGQVKRGKGIACQNNEGDWQVLGDIML